MAEIVILGGAGFTGRLIAKHLLEQSDAGITLASRHIDKVSTLAEKLNSEYQGNRVKSVFADAGNYESLVSAFRGKTMVVVTAPVTAFTEILVKAALDSGIDYLDVELGAKKFAYLQSVSDEIRQSGRCFITESGFHPGLPSALVRFAALQFDVLESAITAGYLNFGKNLPYTESVDELIEVFKDYQAQVFLNGKWTAPGKFKMCTINFGGDIGRKTCYSMFFEELRPFPDLYPSLKEVGFYISESHWVTDWFIMPVVWFSLKIFPNSVRSLGKLLWWAMGSFNKAPYRIELQVQASGVRNGLQKKFTAITSHTDGYELTAIPVVAALLQYLDGSSRKPGLWMMGHFAEPVRLLDDMKRMGVVVSISSNGSES